LSIAADFERYAAQMRERNLRLLLTPVLLSVPLALALHWLIGRVYVDFIVDLSGDTAVGHGAGGLEIPITYIATVVATAACALYCANRAGPSRMMVVIQLVAVVIPLQALVAAQFELARPEFAVIVALAFVGSLGFAGLMPDLILPPASSRARQVMLLVGVLLSAYVYGALIVRGGLGRFSFDLTAVYSVREEFLEGYAPLIGYLVPWQGYVLNPALMLIGFQRRSLILVASGVALQVLLFGMTGFRAFLLIPVLLAGILLIGRRRNLAAGAIAAVIGVIGIALLLYAWLAEPLIPVLLVDRVIMVPAEVHYWYYDFFGVHGEPLLQLSQSLLGAFASAHYTTPIAEVIGWKYLGSAASANVGLFADAFANFGFAGCAVYALLFALVLKVVDAAGRNTDPRVAAALLGMPSFQLVNSSLLTTLLTHGLALAVVVLWVIPPAPGAFAGAKARA
jgi:hypothetical protein